LGRSQAGASGGTCCAAGVSTAAAKKSRENRVMAKTHGNRHASMDNRERRQSPWQRIRPPLNFTPLTACRSVPALQEHAAIRLAAIQSSLSAYARPRCCARMGLSSAQFQPFQTGSKTFRMARIYPFRAWRYNPSLVRLDDVVTQPYDKISPSMQQAYYQRSPLQSGAHHSRPAGAL
jgi:hypothetical protein